MRALQALADALGDKSRRPNALTLPEYHKLRRKKIDSVETISLSSSDVILMEGTISLALKTANTVDTHTIPRGYR